MKPFSYQIEAQAALQQARDDRKTEALVVLASGLGKTALAAFDGQTYLEDGGRLLYLCDQNHVLGQARETFRAVMGDDHLFASLHGNQRDIKAIHKAKCVFSSFQTMSEWHEVFHPGSFDYIVADEVHHIHAPTYRSTLGYFKHDFLLGLTATPDRGDDQDIRSIFGSEVYSLPLELALAQSRLTPVRYHLLGLSPSDVEHLRTEAPNLTMNQLNRLLFDALSDEQISALIRQHAAEIPDARTIVFCSSIDDCESTAQDLPGSLPIHSKLSLGEQDRRLKRFRAGDLRMVLTVDKFNEGLDIPEANLIAFKRATESRRIYLQQLGRGLRLSEGKSELRVLDFPRDARRIEMVHDMWENVADLQRQYQASLGNGAQSAPSFSVSSESGREIVEVIRLVRAQPKQKRERWSVPDIPPEELTQQLWDLGKKLDRLPARTALRPSGLPPARVFVAIFGSWEAALEAAGFCPKGKLYSDAAMEQQLFDLKETLGHKLSVEDLADAVRRGHIANFLLYPFNVRRLTRARGINKNELFEDITAKPVVPGTTRGKGQGTGHPYTREELIGQLVNVIDLLGRRPTGMDDLFRARELGLVVATYQTFRNHFGSFKEAVNAASNRSDEEDKNA